MSKFKTPNGKAFTTVPNYRDEEMTKLGMKLAQPVDKTASKNPKKDAKNSALSKAENGDTRTR